MAQLQLRPLGVGEIVDASFTVYRRRFGPMFMIGLVLVFIPFLVSLVGGCTSEGGETTCSSPIGWLAVAVGTIGTIVAGTAAALVAAGAYAGLPPDWRRATKVGIRRVLPIVAATVVMGLTVGAGYIVTGFAAGALGADTGTDDPTGLVSVAVIVVVAVAGFALWTPIAVFLAVSFAVLWEALIIEGIGPIQSLKRSWQLVTGNRWRLFGAGLLIFIIAVIVFGIIWAVLNLILSGLGMSEGVAGYVGQQVVTLLSIPLSTAAGTVLYLDLRVRKESLDTEGLTAALAEAG